MLRRQFLFTPLLLAQDSEPIRVSVNLVSVPFSARDARGQWITNLTANDVEVLEDGIAQKISFFSRAADSPLSVALVADMSASQDRFLKDHRRDLQAFLKTVIGARDQVMLVCFGNSIRLVSPFGKDPNQVDDALEEFRKGKNIKDLPKIGPSEIRSGGTAFLDAVAATAHQMVGEEGRRAMLLFSDGEDNASALNLMDAVEAAQETGVTVFSLRYTEVKHGTWNARNKYGRSVMTRLAVESGGLDFDAVDRPHLQEAFQQISTMLRATYDLAYVSSQPERDGSFRKIRIRSKVDGLTLRHKTGYFARPLTK